MGNNYNSIGYTPSVPRPNYKLSVNHRLAKARNRIFCLSLQASSENLQTQSQQSYVPSVPSEQSSKTDGEIQGKAGRNMSIGHVTWVAIHLYNQIWLHRL